MLAGLASAITPATPSLLGNSVGYISVDNVAYLGDLSGVILQIGSLLGLSPHITALLVGIYESLGIAKLIQKRRGR